MKTKEGAEEEWSESSWNAIPRIHSGMQRTGWKEQRGNHCGLS